MSKPILVGFDPETLDRAPVGFGLAAARFTGARLIVAAVHAAARVGSGRGAPAQVDEALMSDPGMGFADFERELAVEDIAVECWALESTSAPRALHEAAETRGAGLLVVGSTRRG